MITGILLLATSAWAWALPFAAPILARAGFLLAGARSWLPRGSGATILALAVGVLLVCLLAWRAEAWFNPPPRTYTAAEIEAASYRAINADLRRSLDESLTAKRLADASVSRLAKLYDQQTEALETARAKVANSDAVVVPADDPWLREWHRRGH